MADYIYLPPPTVNIDTTAQTIGQWATLTQDQLSAVAKSFAQEAAGLTGSLWLWRISTVTSLALMAIGGLGALDGKNEGVRSFCGILFCGATLWFALSCIRWSDISSQISNANMWYDRAIRMIETAV